MSKRTEKLILSFLAVSLLFFASINFVFAEISSVSNSTSPFGFMYAGFNTIKQYASPVISTLRGTSHTEQRAGADIRSAINRFLSFSFGGSFSGTSSLSPEEALRIRAQNDPNSENAIPFSSDTISELNVNAPSLFKEQTQFRKDIF